MTDKRKIKALISTLVTSVNSGYHASLSPEDCRILLDLLNSSKPRTEWGMSMNDLIDDLSDVAKGVIDDFASEIIGKPKRRRKK